jgi:hypothetical protein
MYTWPIMEEMILATHGEYAGIPDRFEWWSRQTTALLLHVRGALASYSPTRQVHHLQHGSFYADRCTSSRRSTIWSPCLSEHGAMETTCSDTACTATALKCGQQRLVDHAANDGVHMRLAATRRRSRHAPNVRDDMRPAASRRRKQNVF